MDFMEAIKAHSAWKMKLQAYLVKPDHSLSISVVGADDKCSLGQWLKGEGRIHTNLPEYSALVSQHALFHRAAASVIEKADHGQCVDEEVALGAKSPYAAASSAVVAALMAMRAKV